jgi:RNA polymerase sigma factor (sigma-70 family)
MPSSAPSKSKEEGSLFPVTSWSLICQSQEVANPEALQALDRLARSYWRPLYVYVRMAGQNQQEAEDSVQRFFEQMLTRGSLRAVVPGESRFRSFMITCLKRSMVSEYRAQGRQKRGGQQDWETLTPELEEKLESAAGLPPEVALDRAWAEDIFERSFAQLEADAQERGRAGAFAVLRPVLRGVPPEGGYQALAGNLGVSEGAARKMTFDLRARLGAIIRRAVAATVADPAETEDELRYLFSLL